MANLNGNKVRAIRASDEPIAVLAERYRVSPSAIRDARFGRSWPRAGGRILTPSKTNGVKWEPSASEVEAIVAALRVRGAWADGAAVAGVSVPTLKAYAKRSGARFAAVVEGVS